MHGARNLYDGAHLGRDVGEVGGAERGDQFRLAVARR